jgi:hypothetical protein
VSFGTATTYNGPIFYGETSTHPYEHHPTWGEQIVQIMNGRSAAFVQCVMEAEYHLSGARLVWDIDLVFPFPYHPASHVAKLVGTTYQGRQSSSDDRLFPRLTYPLWVDKILWGFANRANWCDVWSVIYWIAERVAPEDRDDVIEAMDAMRRLAGETHILDVLTVIGDDVHEKAVKGTPYVIKSRVETRSTQEVLTADGSVCHIAGPTDVSFEPGGNDINRLLNWFNHEARKKGIVGWSIEQDCYRW